MPNINIHRLKADAFVAITVSFVRKQVVCDLKETVLRTEKLLDIAGFAGLKTPPESQSVIGMSADLPEVWEGTATAVARVASALLLYARTGRDPVKVVPSFAAMCLCEPITIKPWIEWQKVVDCLVPVTGSPPFGGREIPREITQVVLAVAARKILTDPGAGSSNPPKLVRSRAFSALAGISTTRVSQLTHTTVRGKKQLSSESHGYVSCESARDWLALRGISGFKITEKDVTT